MQPHPSNPVPKPVAFVILGLMLAGMMPLIGCNRSTPQETTASDASKPTDLPAPADQPSVDHLRLASRSIRAGDYATASRALRAQLLRNPDDAVAMEWSGDLASNQNEVPRAIEFYQEAVSVLSSDPTKQPSETLLSKLAKHLMADGRAYDAVDVLQNFIRLYPDAAQPRYDLTGLVTVLGMSELAVEPLRWLVKRHQGDEETLIVLSNPHRVQPDPDFCRKLLERQPDDWRPHYGLAKLDASEQNWAAVVSRLRPVAKRHPEFVAASALLGRAMVEMDVAGVELPDATTVAEQVRSWSDALPAGMDQSIDYWIAAGAWAEHNGMQSVAAGAFANAVRLDGANNGEWLTRWMVSLKRIDRTEDAALVAERLEKIAGLHDATKTFLERSSKSQLAALKVAYQMVALGRMWEAEAWASFAKSLPNDPVSTIDQAYAAIRSRLNQSTPWQSSDGLIANRIDTSQLPAMNWSPTDSGSNSTSPRITQSNRSSAAIVLKDQAERRGLRHQVKLAPEAETKGHWIYQSTGGGAAALDFDLDGWPDIAAANLDGQPMQVDSSPNVLYRNMNGQFEDITDSAGYLDRGFAQGITVGDYDNDGFPDLFDCNIGRNRLYRNNGDGTFTDVSDAVGMRGESWTTSAVLADIDGDGNADAFEVNYCGGRRPYEVACRSESNGKLSSCPPLKFEASADRVWSGVGDGTLRDASQTWMNQTTVGRGLGLLCGQFDERPGMDVFVANDMSVNHLWSFNENVDSPSLSEIATVRGLAMSGQSLSQASMGMTAGDPDGDGDLDFFLTHFAEEHNTYYEQVAPGVWSDRTSAVGLFEPSFDQLGFGTTWSDFDNDGASELLITNGHVSDTGRTDIGYQMQPQLFSRGAAGRWSQNSSPSLGDYFDTEHLGRALVTLDANRDGRIDALITHLYEPVALLINETETQSNWLGLQFKSTSGHRDAIGTRIEWTAKGESRSMQLTAGDGYMASNERRLQMGLGDADRVDSIVVRWPSGFQQTFGPLTAGQDVLLIEGCSEPTIWGDQGNEP